MAKRVERAGLQVEPEMGDFIALNAANARWGSFHDALYGTDAPGDAPTPGPHDPSRGARVVPRAKAFLDEPAPLAEGRHAAVIGYGVETHGAPGLREARAGRPEPWQLA